MRQLPVSTTAAPNEGISEFWTAVILFGPPAFIVGGVIVMGIVVYFITTVSDDRWYADEARGVVTAADLRRARRILRREHPSKDDRWHSDQWLKALRASGVSEARLESMYRIAASDIEARNGLQAPTLTVQTVRERLADRTPETTDGKTP